MSLVYRKILPILFLCLTVVLCNISMVYSLEVVEFGPEETEITGSIKYTVIGKYRANFDKFKGRIELDSGSESITSVYLEIEAETISSSCQWCDKIVRSKQLLDSEKYPKIIFKSSEIIKEEGSYNVRGMLDMHGVQNEIVFPFEAEFSLDETSSEKLVDIGGTWLIPRKDFDVVWNRLLDRGGVLVGNIVTVDWRIKTAISKLKG